MKLVDETTVEFTLDSPNGNFLVPGQLGQLQPRHSPEDVHRRLGVEVHRYRPGSSRSTCSASASCTPGILIYWDMPRIPLAEHERGQVLRGRAGRVLALQGGEVDIVSELLRRGGGALLEDPSIIVVDLVAQHRVIHMWDHRAVHAQARPPGHGAGDRRRSPRRGPLRGARGSPRQRTAPSRPSSRRRTRPCPSASRTSSRPATAAPGGRQGGLTVTLLELAGLRHPDGVLVQNAAEEIGVTVELQLTDDGAYYGDFTTAGSRCWDSPFGITDRATAACRTLPRRPRREARGWSNALHFKKRRVRHGFWLMTSPRCLDLDAQRGVAKQIQELLDEDAGDLPGTSTTTSR